MLQDSCQSYPETSAMDPGMVMMMELVVGGGGSMNGSFMALPCM